MRPDPESELLERVCDAVSKAASESAARRAFVAFSGGVDSALLAAVCVRLGLDPVLLTVGFEGSRDVRFATHVAELMDIEHHVRIIDASDVADTARRVGDGLGECSLSWKENCIAMLHVANLASQLGAKTVITANGIDELFCGYDAYRRVALDWDALKSMMREKIDNEIRMMRAINSLTGELGVSMVQPLLSPGFAEYAMSVEPGHKISGPGDLLRKHLVRSLAERIGVPHKSAYSRKKALQYGTGIHRALRR